MINLEGISSIEIKSQQMPWKPDFLFNLPGSLSPNTIFSAPILALAVSYLKNFDLRLLKFC